MSQEPVEAALESYKRLQRTLLTSTASRWRDLDISMQHLRALYFLRDEDDVSVGRLADLFGVGLPAASRLADGLVRAGHVERRDDPLDRRRVLLSLSRSGSRLVADLLEGSHILLRRWMTALAPADLEALARGWSALADAAARHGQPLDRRAV